MTKHSKWMLLGASLLVSSTLQAQQLVVGLAETDGTQPSVYRTYVNAVARGGHLPIIIPDTPHASETLQHIDVLVLTGGADVDPAWYGEQPKELTDTPNGKRDSFEIALIHEAIRMRKPILGICRGLQIINVALGGTLYQDIHRDEQSEMEHMRKDVLYSPAHGIRIAKNSRLYQLLGTDSIGVNSTHHQAIKDVAPDFYVSARATDGTIEGIESDKYPITGVQFHPERLAIGEDTIFTRLFRYLLKFTR